MSPTPISQDVVNQIIDFLDEDKESLSVTSIVSRGWVHVSRCHLFRRISIIRPRGSFPFDFLTFLQANPHIAIHINQLRLQGDIDDDAFPQLLDALPNLSVLSISDSFSPLRKVTSAEEKRYQIAYLYLDVASIEREIDDPGSQIRTPPFPPFPPMPVPPLPNNDNIDDDRWLGVPDWIRNLAAIHGLQERLVQVLAGNQPHLNAGFQGIGGNGGFNFALEADPDEEARFQARQKRAYNDAVRMHNLLSVFSSIHTLDVSVFGFWNFTTSQLLEIVPDHLMGKLAVTSFRAFHSTSQSFIECFNRILDLSTLEELLLRSDAYPACPSLRNLMESSPNLSNIGFDFGNNCENLIFEIA